METNTARFADPEMGQMGARFVGDARRSSRRFDARDHEGETAGKYSYWLSRRLFCGAVTSSSWRTLRPTRRDSAAAVLRGGAR